MAIKCDLNAFRIETGKKVSLSRRPTEVPSLSRSKKHYRKQLDEYREELIRLQSILYAHGRYALLLIFQGMDTSGKDSAIKHVMSGVNPQGCQVFSFTQPSEEELKHDFLWRTNRRLPERGRIGIFNRSYYEEVLVPRVDPSVLARQALPEEFVHLPRIWRERCEDIVNLEDYLSRNGTRIVKFFLHLSRKEQRRRFLRRIDMPEKNWKLTSSDIDARKQWDAYQAAYEYCLNATHRERAPWYIIPADDKKNARLIISKVIVETMRSLPMEFPSSSRKHLRDLKRIKQILTKEEKNP